MSRQLKNRRRGMRQESGIRADHDPFFHKTGSTDRADGGICYKYASSSLLNKSSSVMRTSMLS